jgi:hypothetical protein
MKIFEPFVSWKVLYKKFERDSCAIAPFRAVIIITTKLCKHKKTVLTHPIRIDSHNMPEDNRMSAATIGLGHSSVSSAKRIP